MWLTTYTNSIIKIRYDIYGTVYILPTPRGILRMLLFLCAYGTRSNRRCVVDIVSVSNHVVTGSIPTVGAFF